MTYCADDVQFIGFLCKADDWSGFANGSYVTITARLEFKFRKEYGEEGPVFYAEEVTAAQKPKEEHVYFKQNSHLLRCVRLQDGRSAFQ